MFGLLPLHTAGPISVDHAELGASSPDKVLRCATWTSPPTERADVVRVDDSDGVVRAQAFAFSWAAQEAQDFWVCRLDWSGSRFALSFAAVLCARRPGEMMHPDHCGSVIPPRPPQVSPCVAGASAGNRRRDTTCRPIALHSARRSRRSACSANSPNTIVCVGTGLTSSAQNAARALGQRAVHTDLVPRSDHRVRHLRYLDLGGLLTLTLRCGTGSSIADQDEPIARLRGHGARGGPHAHSSGTRDLFANYSENGRTRASIQPGGLRVVARRRW